MPTLTKKGCLKLIELIEAGQYFLAAEVLERAFDWDDVVSAELVQQSLGDHAGKLLSFTDARDDFTRNYLSQILQITVGNVSQAARLAKRNRTDFYKLLSRHDLNPDQFKSR